MNLEFEIQEREGTFYSLADLRAMMDQREISTDCYVRPRGKVSWFPLNDLDALVAEAEKATAEATGNQSAQGRSVRNLRPLIVLALFFGVVCLLLLWDAAARLTQVERQVNGIRTRQNALDIRVESVRKGLVTALDSQSSMGTSLHDDLEALRGRLQEAERLGDRLKTDLSNASKRPDR